MKTPSSTPFYWLVTLANCDTQSARAVWYAANRTQALAELMTECALFGQNNMNTSQVTKGLTARGEIDHAALQKFEATSLAKEEINAAKVIRSIAVDMEFLLQEAKSLAGQAVEEAQQAITHADNYELSVKLRNNARKLRSEARAKLAQLRHKYDVTFDPTSQPI